MYDPLIRKLEAVTDLSAEDRDELRQLSRDVREYPAKADIISEGELPDNVLLVVEGWAARYKILPNGSRQIIGLLLPGDFCGIHVAILANMDHSILALTPCRVAHVPNEQLSRLTSRPSSLSRALWRLTLVDEAITREWLLNVGRREAYEAVAHLLCELHSRMQLIGAVSERGDFAMPLTQEEIGDATALTSVHVNRTLQRLRKDGLIELSHRELCIPDVAALREVAGFRSDYLHCEPCDTNQPRAILWRTTA